MGSIEWAKSKLEKTQQAISYLNEQIPGQKKILICSHLEAKLIAFAKLLHESGNDVHLVSNLPSSIKSDLLDEVINIGLTFHDTSSLTFPESEKVISQILSDYDFDFVFDDGAHTYSKLSKETRTIFTEFTQSGVNIAKKLALKAPVINLNSSFTKRVIGNLYGTGVSTLAAIQTISNINFHGLKVGVIGLGPIGLSCSKSFIGAGSIVRAYDVNKSLSARALKNNIIFCSKQELLKECDLILTCTGHSDAICDDDFSCMKNGVILANIGHFNTEIKLPNVKVNKINKHISSFKVNERNIFLLASGNLVNLASGMGYPIQIIDQSFAASVYAWEHQYQKNYLGLINYPEVLDKKFFEKEMILYQDFS